MPPAAFRALLPSPVRAVFTSRRLRFHPSTHPVRDVGGHLPRAWRPAIWPIPQRAGLTTFAPDPIIRVCKEWPAESKERRELTQAEGACDGWALQVARALP